MLLRRTLGDYSSKPFLKWKNLMRCKSSVSFPDVSKESAKTDSANVSNIKPGSKEHNDLRSFEHHAAKTGISTTSTVYIGTHYEYTVMETLKSYGFSLQRTGRASDLGIDLLGHWSVPSLPIPLRVLIQCKARGKRLAPETVRELEGAFSGAPAGWQGDGVLGFLVAAQPATKGMRDALTRSKLPVGFFQISRSGQAQQCLWNHVAGDGGLEGVGVVANYVEGGERGLDVEKEIALTWNGWTVSRKTNEVKKPETRDSHMSKAGVVKEKPATRSVMQESQTKSKAEEEGNAGHPRLAIKKPGRPPKYK